MRKFLISLMLSIVSVTSARLTSRENNDPAGLYLSSMCYPLFSNTTRVQALHLSASELIISLANSPFPCEQAAYIEAICGANGTTEIDFLAEQECLCGGSYFEMTAGCNACYFEHGFQETTPESAAASLSSLSNAECEPTPPFQPFSNLLTRVNITSIELSPPLTLGTDKFPNNTAISNYFSPTGTGTPTPGAITGSATGRRTSFTNFDGNIYTPTSIPPNNGTSIATSAGATTSPPTETTGSGGNAASSSSSTKSANAAAQGEVKLKGGLLAGLLGVVALL